MAASKRTVATTKKAKTPKPGPQCKCVQQFNEQLVLQDTNTKIKEDILLDFENNVSFCLPRIHTAKIDKKLRKPVKTVLPKFCPFCGKAYVL